MRRLRTTESRRRTVRRLLEEHSVSSQAELLELLGQEGIAATQPQLSRDLRALGVSKQGGRYALAERVTGLESLAMLLRDARPAGANLVVVTCEPGSAAAVARALEAESPSGVVGTIAGDDTILLIARSAAARKRLAARLADLAAGG